MWTVGRLKRNVSLQAASSDLGEIAKLSEKDYPAWFRANYRIVVNSLRDDSVGHFKATLFAMVAAVLILLLIACSNVANLLFARATMREKGDRYPCFDRRDTFSLDKAIVGGERPLGSCKLHLRVFVGVSRVERDDSRDSS